ncbi:hypothetical protein [Salinarimonas soli]|uniref:Uncharacterized protein n=1 Tax=Salinarimonas soli TaxID=1638099 RepID=A0A5B2VIK7_9HYPH|nr:hypothetical protein [Salinarimonas soli]KAA2238017.1 hypothetical protein F0L46_07025 [Salinarimonas soli]
MKRFIGLSLVAASLMAASAPASARDGQNAAAAALGVVGGLALGAIASQPPPPPATVYVRRPAPVYVESYEEEPVCVIKRRRYVDEFGDVTIRRIKVCD